MYLTTKNEFVEVHDGIRLTRRDVEVMELMYFYRAVIPVQLAEIYKVKTSSMRIVMLRLVKHQYVLSRELTGYRVNQSRQGKYYRLSAKGLELLKSNSYTLSRYSSDEFNRDISELRLTPYFLPYIINANDVGFSCMRYGWVYRESRSAKEISGLDRNASLHGSLENKEGVTTWLYGMIKKVSPKNFAKMASEMIRWASIRNVLVTAKSSDAYKQALTLYSYVDSEKNVSLLSRLASLKVLEMNYAKLYYSAFQSDKEVYNFLAKNFQNEMRFLRNDEWKQKNKYSSLDYVVEMEDAKEYYIINLMDNDLVKLKNIKRYSHDYYLIEKRKLVIITTNHLKQYHKSFFRSKGYEHIMFGIVDVDKIKLEAEKYRT